MTFNAKHLAFIVTIFGIASFIFGVVAENLKPEYGSAVTGKDVVICQYPSNPSVALGYMSFVFLVASTVVGYISLFYPYKGKSLPYSLFFKNQTFLTFFNIALFTSGVAATLTIWPTIQEQYHLKHKVHPISTTECPTAKTGLIGGGAFVSLDSSLLWLVALMLAINVREDNFDDSNFEPNYGAQDVY